jgi:SPP1 family holin
MKLHIKPETVARTFVLVLALVNQCLSAAGKSPLPINSEMLEQFVTAGITTAAALWAWWENNSFTQNALQADEYLHNLTRRK